MLFVDLALTSRRVAETSKRSEKVALLAAVLTNAPPGEIVATVAFGVGETPGSGLQRHVVHVRPEQVVEIAVDVVQVSTRYPGGVARRFARVRHDRHDEPAGQADTIEQVQALLAPLPRAAPGR